MIGVGVQPKSGEGLGLPRMVMPREKVQIVPNWDVSGLPAPAAMIWW